MICSRNEIRAVLHKAAVGSGFPVGLARDLAAAGVWLCVRGFDGVGVVLKAIATDVQSDVDWQPANGSVQLADVAVGRCGPSPFELLAAGDVEQISIERPDAPLLLIGLAGVIAGSTERAFALSVGSDAPVIVTAEAVNSGERLPFGHVGAVSITAVDLPDPAPSDQPPLSYGIEIDERAWATATELAARTYVPASEESRRRGAGAGLTDND